MLCPNMASVHTVAISENFRIVWMVVTANFRIRLRNNIGSRGKINQHGVSTRLSRGTRKWCQHTILRMLKKQNLCRKQSGRECIRICVDSENDSKTIGIRYVWARIFWNPKKKQTGYKNFRIRGDGVLILIF